MCLRGELRVLAKEIDQLFRFGGVRIFKILTADANDPDVHIHQWLTGKVPVGITAPIEPGGVFPIVSPQSVGKETVADELLKKEVRNGYVQWCANRAELEQEVGTLHLWRKLPSLLKGPKSA